MNYSKPEITVLGSAALVIQGSTSKNSELVDPSIPLTASDCELDD